jgi:RecA-family ATPase
MSTIERKSIDWLWPSRIPLGKLTLLVGDPDIGKSIISLDVSARVSRGTPWPDAPDMPHAIGSVILLSAEDDPEDTIAPRLDAAGADPTKIHRLHFVRYDDGVERVINLRADIEQLGVAIDQIQNCRLVVIDPIPAFLGVDGNKNANVWGALAPLASLAAKKRVAILGR